jgi:hypothetical protein
MSNSLHSAQPAHSGHRAGPLVSLATSPGYPDVGEPSRWRWTFVERLDRSGREGARQEGEGRSVGRRVGRPSGNVETGQEWQTGESLPTDRAILAVATAHQRIPRRIPPRGMYPGKTKTEHPVGAPAINARHLLPINNEDAYTISSLCWKHAKRVDQYCCRVV